MASVRAELQGALQSYLSDTSTDLRDLQSFMERSEECVKALQSLEEEMELIRRHSEAHSMADVICGPLPWFCERGRGFSSSCGCEPSCENSGSRRACVLGRASGSGGACCSLDHRLCVCVCCSSWEEEKRKERSGKLEEALKKVVQRLNELERPLQAIERLAVTSEQVFDRDPQRQVDIRAEDISTVCRALSDVRAVSPWVTMFKQAQIFKTKQENVNPSPERREGTSQAVVMLLNADTRVIQMDPINRQQNTGPSQVNQQITLENIEPLLLRLQALICALKNIFRPLQDSAVKELRLAGSPLQVHVSEELTEERAALMLEHIRGLKKLRDNGDERLVFLLRAEAQTLRTELQERVPEMDKCVKAVQSCAEELTPTCRSPRKSSCCASGMGVVLNWGIVSSVLGIVASVLSLRVMFSMWSSPSQLLNGAIVSGVSGLILLCVILADVWLNKSQKVKANAVCEWFQGHVKVLRRSLDSTIYSLTERIPEKDQTIMGSLIGYKSLRVFLMIIDIASDVYTRITAGEVPDIRLAWGGPWCKAKFMYVLGIGTNSAILVWDAYTIIKNLWVLWKEKEPATSQWLRARASLWEAEVETWKQIRDGLERGLTGENSQLLTKPFYI